MHFSVHACILMTQANDNQFISHAEHFSILWPALNAKRKETCRVFKPFLPEPLHQESCAAFCRTSCRPVDNVRSSRIAESVAAPSRHCAECRTWPATAPRHRCAALRRATPRRRAAGRCCPAPRRAARSRLLLPATAVLFRAA